MTTATFPESAMTATERRALRAEDAELERLRRAATAQQKRFQRIDALRNQHARTAALNAALARAELVDRRNRALNLIALGTGLLACLVAAWGIETLAAGAAH